MKEQTRQQKQREKAERKSQRSTEKPEGVDELEEMREHAKEQAALFRIGMDDGESSTGEGEGNGIER
ncbi:MAG TPA: hypothetical protein VFA68_05230 [Terriglobales bacterium]|nr:hypothetical protein [Terriglobales bacterium]